MTRMQYLHLTGVIPRMSGAFEGEWEKENRKRFERNHPMSCRHRDDEHRKNEKIYQKFNFGRRPKEPLSGDGLIQAIKICSERPDQCFYLEEALCQLGHHNIYSYEDRLNALLITTHQTGQAVLVEEGFGGGGGSSSVKSSQVEEGFISKTGRETLGLTEAFGGFVQNSAAYIQSRAEGVVHGVLQASKGDIKDAFDTMNAVKEDRYEKYSHELSDNAKEVVANDLLIQKTSSVLNDTVGVALNTVDEVAKKSLSEDAYFYVTSIADPLVTLSPLGIGPVKSVRVGGQYQRAMFLSKKASAYQNRIDVVRNKLPSRLRNSGNLAIADVEISGVKKEFLAHSKIHSPTSKGADLADFSYSKDRKIFDSYIEDKGFPRFNDTEAKILEDIASKIDSSSKGKIDLYTKLPPCNSCSNIISEFRDKFPKIELNVYHGDMI